MLQVNRATVCQCVWVCVCNWVKESRSGTIDLWLASQEWRIQLLWKPISNVCISVCVWWKQERDKRGWGGHIIIYMVPPLAWVLPWQHYGCRPKNRVTVVMNTPGNCWCQCSKVGPKVPLGWSGRLYTNAHTHTHTRSAWTGQLLRIWKEVFLN